MESGIRRHHHQPIEAARRVLRLVARALHDGRGVVARGAKGVRRALPRGSDLQRQAAGQLGSQAQDRHLRSRSAAGRDQGQSLVHQVSGRRQRRIHRRGDDAAAVHPGNERLKHLIGKTAILPLVGRRILIIGDDYADPEKGSGAVKITPAHDFNDFEVGKRHDLPLINVLDDEAHLTLKNNDAFLKDAHPELTLLETLDGKSREAARKSIVEHLESRGLIEKIEPTSHVVPHGDRSGAVLEPYLTDQWYVDAKTLAELAIKAVRAGDTKFIPQQWDATFFNWMENIQPWC